MRPQAILGAYPLVLFLLVVAAGCRPDAAVTPQRLPPKVAVCHPVVREIRDEDDYSGWLQAAQTVDVRARVSGHILKVDFHDGDIVVPGQLLFELDPRPFQVSIAEAIAQSKSIEAQKQVAERLADRQRDLVRKGAVSQQELDESEAKAASYGAQVAAKMQDVERFKLDLEYARITAPIGGRIGRALITEGNLVNAGGSEQLLTTIVSIDPIYTYFTIDERSLQRYQKNGRGDHKDQAPASLREQKIPFSFGLDIDEGYPHHGVLDFADNKVDTSTGTIQVRGVVQNPQGQFVPGSRVRIRIAVSAKYGATLVPDTAVNTDQDKRYLLVVDNKNVVLRRDVKLGRLLDDGMRLVLSAQPELKPDDWIICEGMQLARLNYPVEPIKETAPVNNQPPND